MRILYLTPRIPYPPNKGDKVRTFNTLRYLSRRHSVTLVSLVDHGDSVEHLAPLRALCDEVVLIDNGLAGARTRAGLALVLGKSASEGFFGKGSMRRTVASLCEHRSFDTILVMSSALAQYLPDAGREHRVVDVVDVDSDKWRQFATNTAPPLSWLFRLESRRVARLESELAHCADALVFISIPERETYRHHQRTEVPTFVVPVGVDTTHFAPSTPPCGFIPPRLLFTGALDYRPNIDALQWFMRSILPLIRLEIPAIRLIAVGHRPSPAVRRLARRHPVDLEIRGSVPDIRPFFAEATVFVAPLRLGRGMKVKILEAMAMGTAIVGTSVAAAGIDVRSDREVLIADSAESFARAVVKLLQDDAYRLQLAGAARRKIEALYTWEAPLAAMEQVLTPPRAPQATTDSPEYPA